MPGCFKQLHALACHSCAARKLGSKTTSQLGHYVCQVASATACVIMPQLCCEKAWLENCKPAWALCVPGCFSNCMRWLATAVQRDSLASTEASLGTMCARLLQQLHALVCHSYAVRKLGLNTTNQLGHYVCPVALATACVGMPKLCCAKAWLDHCKPTWALCVPGCFSNCMRWHATAVL